VLGASELARLSIERWNAGDLDAVYVTWDPQVIVRPTPTIPTPASFSERRLRAASGRTSETSAELAA
jgi:hypothetical protein